MLGWLWGWQSRATAAGLPHEQELLGRHHYRHQCAKVVRHVLPKPMCLQCAGVGSCGCGLLWPGRRTQGRQLQQALQACAVVSSLCEVVSAIHDCTVDCTDRLKHYMSMAVVHAWLLLASS